MTQLHEDQKVFGVGLSKTGTSTLAEALNILGVRSIHYPHDARTFEQLKHGDYRLSILENYQGVTDTPVAPYFAQLDEAWPGSKFILTIRDKASWMASAEGHWRVLKEKGANARNDDFQTFADFVSAVVYGCLYFNAERFSYAYDMHVRAVHDYFLDRPGDFLVLDICGGKAGWKELCGFLGRPVPRNIPFPHAYRSNWRNAEAAKADLAAIAPNGEPIIIIDHDGLRNYLAAYRHVRAFVELDDRYWGLPENDQAAIEELEWLRTHKNAGFLAVSASSLWFLDRFAEFATYLRSRYSCVLTNERLLVFDLTS